MPTDGSTVPRLLCIPCEQSIFVRFFLLLPVLPEPLGHGFWTRKDYSWKKCTFCTLKLLWVHSPLGPGDLPRLCCWLLEILICLLFSAWLYTHCWLMGAGCGVGAEMRVATVLRRLKARQTLASFDSNKAVEEYVGPVESRAVACCLGQ